MLVKHLLIAILIMAAGGAIYAQTTDFFDLLKLERRRAYKLLSTRART